MISAPDHSGTATPHSVEERPAPSIPSTRMSSIKVLAVLSALSVFDVATDQFLGGTHELDRALLLGGPAPFDHTPSVGSTRIAKLAWSFTALGSPELVVLLTASVMGFLLLFRRYAAALFLLTTVGSGTGFAYLLKKLFGFLRPHHATAEMGEVLNTTFPSGHAMLAALLYFSLAAIVPMIAPRDRLLFFYASALAIGVTGAVGLSRLVLGLHWPSDVAAGWVVGALWVTLCRSGLSTSTLRISLRRE